MCSAATASAPASAATVAATRTTRARPRAGERKRVDGAHEQIAGLPTQRGRPPAAVPRPVRPAREPQRTASPGTASSSCPLGLGTCTTRSKRSSNARESFSPYAASFCGEQRHSTAGSPRAPHGQRFIVADQDEPRREDRLARDPRDRDDAVLERLAQRFQHGAMELGELVEEQHAVVCEAHLAGTRARGRRPRPPRQRRCDAERGTAPGRRAGGRPEGPRPRSGSA